MRFGSIGGALVIGGCVVLVAIVAIALSGGPVGLGVSGLGGLTVIAAMALLGLGAGVLSLAGPPSLDGRSVRTGLGLLALGLLISVATANAPIDSTLIFALLLGGAISAIGALVTVLSLVRSPGRPRRVGLLFVGGFLSLVVWGGLANALLANTALDGPILHALTSGLAILGAGAMWLGVAGIGLIGIADLRTGALASA